MKNWLQTSRAALVACVLGLFLSIPAQGASSATVSITTPAPGLHTTNSQLNVTGTAHSSFRSDPIVAIDLLLNGNPQSVSGTTNWSASVTLQPGTNVIAVQSVSSSNVQSVIQTRTVTLDVFATVTVTNDGRGTIQSSLIGKRVLVGKTISLLATPAPDWTFVDWTDDFGTVTNGPRLRYTVQQDTTLVAHFAPNPLQKARGIYNGLIINSNNITSDSSGAFNLVVSKPDLYLLKLNVGGVTGTATGHLDSSGAADFSTPGRNPITGHIQVDTSGTTFQVTGNITSPVTASLSGDMDVFGGTNLCPYAGQYNMIISSNAVVQGEGFATVNVDASGSLRMQGMLGDGTAISQSTTVSTNGSWPLFVTPYGRQGSFLGWITITNIAQSSLHGVCYWFHPAMARGRFTNEFSQRNDVVGSLFIQPPPGVSMMAWTDGQANVSGDNLPYPLSSHLTWSSNNNINVDLNDFTLHVTPLGGIRGTLVHPVTHARQALQGVVLPKTNWAGGLFLDTNSSGSFYIGEDMSAGTNILVQAPGDISSFTGHPAVLTLTLDKKTGLFAGSQTMTFDFGDTGTITVTSSDITDFGTAIYNYSSYVSTAPNIAELNIIGGSLGGGPLRHRNTVIRMLLNFTDNAGQNGTFIATVTAGGSGTATGTFTLP